MRVRRVTHGERRQKQVGPRARLYVCRYVSLYIHTYVQYGYITDVKPRVSGLC